MDESQRRQLLADLFEALDERGMAQGAQLLELARLEHTLMDALAFVRRQIDIIARASRPRREGD